MNPERRHEALLLAAGFIVCTASTRRPWLQITCTCAGLILLLHWIMQGVHTLAPTLGGS